MFGKIERSANESVDFLEEAGVEGSEDVEDAFVGVYSSHDAETETVRRWRLLEVLGVVFVDGFYHLNESNTQGVPCRCYEYG